MLLLWSWWPDLNRRPADYESAALPTELHQQENGDPMGIRTPVCAVRGRRPRPLDDGAKLVDREGLEPSTVRLRVGCSTIELAVQLR